MFTNFAGVALNTLHMVLGDSRVRIIPKNELIPPYSAPGTFTTSSTEFDPVTGTTSVSKDPKILFSKSDLKHQIEQDDHVLVQNKIWKIHDYDSDGYVGVICELHEVE